MTQSVAEGWSKEHKNPAVSLSDEFVKQIRCIEGLPYRTSTNNLRKKRLMAAFFVF